VIARPALVLAATLPRRLGACCRQWSKWLAAALSPAIDDHLLVIETFSFLSKHINQKRKFMRLTSFNFRQKTYFS
jgi:hypothetical protein